MSGNGMTQARVIAAIVAITLTLTSHPIGVIVGFVVSTTWAIAFERKVLRRVARPKFWVFTITITLLAGLWLGENPQPWHGVIVSREGFIAGIMMNLRAFSLVVAVIMLAKSLSRGRVLAATSRLGLPELNPAFETAMESMPEIQNAWKDAWQGERTWRGKSLARLLLWMVEMAKGPETGPQRIFAVTGYRGAGKSSFIQTVASMVEEKGFEVAGVTQERCEDNEGSDFHAVHWGSDEKMRIAVGRKGLGFTFDPEAFARVGVWLLEENKQADLLIIDELGLLEARGLGYMQPLIEVLLSNPRVVVLLALRKDRLDVLTEMIGMDRDRVLDLNKGNADREGFASQILARIQG